MFSQWIPPRCKWASLRPVKHLASLEQGKSRLCTTPTAIDLYSLPDKTLSHLESNSLRQCNCRARHFINHQLHENFMWIHNEQVALSEVLNLACRSDAHQYRQSIISLIQTSAPSSSNSVHRPHRLHHFFLRIHVCRQHLPQYLPTRPVT